MRVINVFVDDGGVAAALYLAIYRWLRMPMLSREPILKRIDSVLRYDEADREELCEFLLTANNPAAKASNVDDERLMSLCLKFVMRIKSSVEYVRTAAIASWRRLR